MPKNKLKPVIRYSQYELAGYDNYRGATKYLCLPLTLTSRKVMIEAMGEKIREAYAFGESIPEAALDALLKLAEEKQ